MVISVTKVLWTPLQRRHYLSIFMLTPSTCMHTHKRGAPLNTQLSDHSHWCGQSIKILWGWKGKKGRAVVINIVYCEATRQWGRCNAPSCIGGVIDGPAFFRWLMAGSEILSLSEQITCFMTYVPHQPPFFQFWLSLLVKELEVAVHLLHRAPGRFQRLRKGAKDIV